MPDRPVLYFMPARLREAVARFRDGFPGLTTYAVKANDAPAVVENLAAAGIGGFDVASPQEMAAVRALNAQAVLHYNNPVRSPAEVAAGIAAGVASWSVDDPGELDKLSAVPRDREIAVRFAPINVIQHKSLNTDLRSLACQIFKSLHLQIKIHGLPCIQVNRFFE